MVYFSDFFDVDESIIEAYGAFNVSLINDLPLFIDPFLLFGSDKPEYKLYHQEMLKYLSFLKSKSEQGVLNDGQITAWYQFPEVVQNWLGYSMVGNSGRGLGKTFGKAFSSNISKVFSDLGHEEISSSSHLEKAALFEIGVGKDNVSDFTCNLIKAFLLHYTEEFAIQYLQPRQRKKVKVNKVYFDYAFERWMPKEYTLPYIFDDFVLLTPKDILTKDDTWINSHDLIGNFDNICSTIPNSQLRAEIHNYFKNVLPKKKNKKAPTQKERNGAIRDTIWKYPKLMDYYIKLKEEGKLKAKTVSKKKVSDVESLFIQNVMALISQLETETDFYNSTVTNSYTEAYNRIMYLKDVIENKDGYRLFYVDGEPIKREADLQIIYRLTWFSTSYDVNREPNNGRGPVDYSVSKGSKDKSLVEFKLASNSQLARNLENQVAIYEKANDTNKSIKVIMYFDLSELVKVKGILKELKLTDSPHIVLIDARKDNKPSASKAKTKTL